MLDVKKEMTFEEVKNFFSNTEEFTVKDISGMGPVFKLTLTDSGPDYSHRCSTLMTKATIQLLIREIKKLTYNIAVKNYDYTKNN